MGVDIITLIFKSEEAKVDNANLEKLTNKIAQLQRLHHCYTKATPIALIKKTEAEIAILQCQTGEKPGIIAECGIDLSVNGIIETAKNIIFACIKGFSPTFSIDWNNITKTSMAVTLKPFSLSLASSKIFNPEEQLELKDVDAYTAYPWDAFEEAYIPEKVLNLINSLSINPFVYRIMLASLVPDSTETLLLTQCADTHCRIVAHWGPEPLGFKITGLHSK